MGQVSGLGAGGCELSAVAGLALPCREPTPRLIELLSSSLFLLSAGNYRTQLYDKQREEYQPATPGLGMFVEVKDPEDKVSWPLPASSKLRYFFFVSFRICSSEVDKLVMWKDAEFSLRGWAARGCWTGSCFQLLSFQLQDSSRSFTGLEPLTYLVK